MNIEQIFSPACCLSNAMNAVSDPQCNQKLVAGFYADCIRSGTDKIDWKALNEAISTRWQKGLIRIKKMAWRQVSGDSPTTVERYGNSRSAPK